MLDDFAPRGKLLDFSAEWEGRYPAIATYRVKGKLYMQRVTPKHGRPYILMDHKGDGTFSKQDNTLDNGVRVPQWVLREF